MANRSPMRTLGPTERIQMAADLQGLAEELMAAHSGAVQRLLREAMDVGFPTRGSTSPVEPANQTDAQGIPVQPDSMPERLALRPDRMAAEAHHLLTMLRRTARLVQSCRRELGSWDPTRPVRRCVRCGHPLAPDQTRCQQLDDEGRQCGARETEARKCRICGQTQPAGRALRQGRCNACRMFWERNGRDRATVNRLQLGGNVQTEEPTPSAQDEGLL